MVFCKARILPFPRYGNCFPYGHLAVTFRSLDPIEVFLVIYYHPILMSASP